MDQKILSNNKGQGVIEACLCALVLLFFLKLFFVATYSCYASLLLNHHTHELAHCLGSYSSHEWRCRRDFKSRIQKQLPWGKLGQLRLQSENKSYVAKSEFYVINQWKLTSQSRAITKK